MPLSDGTGLLSPEATQQALSADGTIPFIPFIKITAGAEVHRFCCNTETLTRDDGDYDPASFDITWGDDTESSSTPVVIELSMVKRDVCDRIMAHQGEIEVEGQCALATSPNITEFGGKFILRDATANSIRLRATLGVGEGIYEQVFPKRRMTPSSHPGMF